MNIKMYVNPKAKFIGKYSLIDLITKDHIHINDNLTDQEFDNLKYLKNNFSITIDAKYATSDDELKYYKNITRIIQKLKATNKKYKITIEVTNRQILKQSSLLANIPKNIDLTILNDDYAYNVTEYLIEEQKLENLIAPVRKAELSPLEKYVAVYDIVKNFKQYKDNTNDIRQSRKLRYILRDDNEYIVCVGFAKLLLELLNRIDIPCKYIHVDVDSSYEHSDENEAINVTHIGHARNLVRIDDDKYNVHGIYLSDSTFDSGRSKNIYLHCLFTFDKLKEAKKLEKLNDIDLLLDFHNTDEFKKKIAYFLKKESKRPENINDDEITLTKKTYKALYITAMNIIRTLDKQTFIKLHNKYNNNLCDNITNIDLNELNQITSNFLTEYYNYVITLTNKEIDINTILTAATVAKKQISKLSNEDLAPWLRKLIDDNYSEQDIKFPYIYNPNNNTEAYVEAKSQKNKRS